MQIALAHIQLRVAAMAQRCLLQWHNAQFSTRERYYYALLRASRPATGSVAATAGATGRCQNSKVHGKRGSSQRRPGLPSACTVSVQQCCRAAARRCSALLCCMQWSLHSGRSCSKVQEPATKIYGTVVVEMRARATGHRAICKRVCRSEICQAACPPATSADASFNTVHHTMRVRP